MYSVAVTEREREREREREYTLQYKMIEDQISTMVILSI